MKNFKYNELKAALSVCVVCAVTIMAVAILALILPDIFTLTILAVFGIAAGALLVSALALLYFRTRSELRFFISLIENFGDIGFIKYNKEKNIAVCHGNIEAITGVKMQSNTPGKQDYDALLDDLYRREHDFEDDVYSSEDGKNWYRLGSYESDKIACTTIRDVTEYIDKIGTINSLRYCDSLTGLLNKEAITDILRRKIENSYNSLGIVHFAVNGIEKIISFEGSDAADDVLVNLAASARSLDNSKSIFTARTGNSGFTVVLTQSDHEFDDYLEVIEAIHASFSWTISSMAENIRQYINVYCGYVIYRTRETDADKMLAAAEFAAFDALKKNDSAPVRYDSASYKERESEFSKIRIFNEIISEELIDYHFQPIVNAHTGDIYGYEALMRPREINSVRLTPLEILSIAEEHSMLERIESQTFYATLKILSEHQDVFRDKRLFINSVSCVTLKEAEYSELVEAYGELFPKLTIEITEINRLSEDIIPMLNKFFKPHRVHIALDDYGAGYSNDKTLLDVMPNYIKIDRSLISGISSDPKKKQLVANIVSYAADHGVYSLAEGVETEEELETVIFLGIDLIQGYFTCRPVPIFMHEISPDVRELIVKYSAMHSKRNDRIFEVKDDTPVDLASLASFGYTDIIIRHGTVSFFGNAGSAYDMRIICPDDSSVFMTLTDVNLHCDDYPVIDIGKNSTFTLHLEGQSALSKQGIRVPETTVFTLEGSGNLIIDGSAGDSVCLGGNSTQSFGRLNLDGTGELVISNKCDKCICIGGGIGGKDSVININSGILALNARGVDALGIGTHEGDVSIVLDSCSIKADVSGTNAVAVGSLRGSTDIRSNADISVIGAGNNCCLIGSQHGATTDIHFYKGTVDINASGMSITGIGTADGVLKLDSNADITMTASGDDCCLIGSHSGKDGSINIDNGSIKLTCNAKRIAAIGSLSGKCDVSLNSGLFDILCEGNTALCVGNLEGSGDIKLGGIVMSAVNNSALRQSIATCSGKLTISSGNICTNSLDPLDAFNIYGSRLICRTVKAEDVPDKTFEQIVDDNGSTYRYIAKPSPLFEDFCVYLPE